MSQKLSTDTKAELAEPHSLIVFNYWISVKKTTQLAALKGKMIEFFVGLMVSIHVPKSQQLT